MGDANVEAPALGVREHHGLDTLVVPGLIRELGIDVGYFLPGVQVAPRQSDGNRTDVQPVHERTRQIEGGGQLAKLGIARVVYPILDDLAAVVRQALIVRLGIHVDRVLLTSRDVDSIDYDARFVPILFAAFDRVGENAGERTPHVRDAGDHAATAEIDLPAAKHCLAADAEKAVVITITAGQTPSVYLGDVKSGGAIDPYEVEWRLKKAAEDGKNAGKAVVLIKAEKQVRLRDLVRISAAATSVKGMKLNLAVIEKN